MGSIIGLSCQCGARLQLPLGPSPRQPPKVCFFLFLCRACKFTSNLNIHAERLACQHCGSEDVVPYGAPEAIGQAGPNLVLACWPCERFPPEVLRLTDGRYWCPTCETFGLSFSEQGHWD